QFFYHVPVGSTSLIIHIKLPVGSFRLRSCWIYSLIIYIKLPVFKLRSCCSSISNFQFLNYVPVGTTSLIIHIKLPVFKLRSCRIYSLIIYIKLPVIKLSSCRIYSLIIHIKLPVFKLRSCRIYRSSISNFQFLIYVPVSSF
ncbi:hypothetical protein LOTGIDRAFT_145438, partial [Lottia gigantea]